MEEIIPPSQLAALLQVNVKTVYRLARLPVPHPLRALDGGLTGGCFGNSSILGGHSSKADSYHFANVVTPLGTDKLFSFYDSSNTDLGDIPSSLANIKRIKITFGVQVINPNPNVGGNIFSTLSTSVLLRNE